MMFGAPELKHLMEVKQAGTGMRSKRQPRKMKRPAVAVPRDADDDFIAKWKNAMKGGDQ